MGFFNLCCRSGGSNLNAGTRKGDTTIPGTSASFTYTSGVWVNATRTFTVASGNPSTDGIVAGDYAAIDTGGSIAAFIARVTSVTGTTIVLDATDILGSNPANGTYTLRIGGAWQGPSGSSGWPFTQAFGNFGTGASSTIVRLNLKNVANFSITAVIGQGSAGPAHVWGFTNTYGDGGIATINGGTSGASYNLLTTGLSGATQLYKCLEFKNNGATGNANGVAPGNFSVTFENCVFRDLRGNGFITGGSNCGVNLINCEIYNCNQSNSATTAGVNNNGGWLRMYLCSVHDNVTRGVMCSGATSIVKCIIESNGAEGIYYNHTYGSTIIACDIYNNATNGISIFAGQAMIMNNRIFKNGTTGSHYGINFVGANVFIRSNTFGTGTQANNGGNFNSSNNANDENSTNYSSNLTPWIDPANGNFGTNPDAEDVGTGFETFLTTASGRTQTTGYVDRGASQHQESDAGGAMFFH